MRRGSYSSLILLATFILLFGCKEKCDEYYLGSLVSMNQYLGTEKLIFHNSKGEDVIFNGMGRVVRMNTVSAKGSGDICEKSEWDDCYFDEEFGSYDLKVSLRPLSEISQSSLILTISDYQYNDNRPHRSSFQFYLPLNQDNLREDQFFYDSLIIQSSTYYDVFASVPGLDTSPIIKSTNNGDTTYPSLIYFHLVAGIIKVDFDDGSTWELKELIK